MEITRRSFFGGALALAAVVALPEAAFADVPTIYGDGVHDDWAGLQALFDGKPFRVVGNEVMAVQSEGSAYLSKGAYRVSRTIKLGNHCSIRITDCHFTNDGAGPLFHLEEDHGPTVLVGNVMNPGRHFASA